MASDLPSLKLCQNYSEKMCEILEKVLQEITPPESLKNTLKKLVNEFIQHVIEILEKYGVDARVELHGSFARDTWLKSSRDADVFILFTKELPKESIKEILRILEQELPYRSRYAYAEHPYLQVELNSDFKVDLVPGFSLGRIISAVDRTPLHTQFLRAKLTEPLKFEARLLKAFLKGTLTYGAEIKTEGISGYASELLILHFGSFLSTLENLSLGKRIFIDFHNKWDVRKAFKVFNNPIVIIDPVDPNRNVTSALSWDTFYRISFASLMFLEKPTIKFFQPTIKEYHQSLFRDYIQRYPFVIISLELNDVPKDVYWGQAKRILRDISNYLTTMKYNVFYKLAIKDDNKILLFMIVLDKDKRFDLRRGPPIRLKQNMMKFLDRWNTHGVGPIIRRGALYFVTRIQEDIAERILEFMAQNVKLEPSFRSFDLVDPRDLKLSKTATLEGLLHINPLSVWYEDNVSESSPNNHS